MEPSPEEKMMETLHHVPHIIMQFSVLGWILHHQTRQINSFLKSNGLEKTTFLVFIEMTLIVPVSFACLFSESSERQCPDENKADIYIRDLYRTGKKCFGIYLLYIISR
jgi:hypothetical protein